MNWTRISKITEEGIDSDWMPRLPPILFVVGIVLYLIGTLLK